MTLSPRSRGIAGALLFLAVACEGTLITIPIEDSATTTVSKGTLLETLLEDFGFGDFIGLDVTASETLQNQGVQPGDIQDVRLVAFDLEVLSPEGADLSFLDSLEVYIEAPGLPRVLVASSTDFDGATQVSMDLEDVDLTDYAVSRSMTISTDAEGRRPAEDTQVRASYTLSVGVTGQGACNYLTGQSGPGT